MCCHGCITNSTGDRQLRVKRNMSCHLSFHVLSLPRLCSIDDTVLQVHTNGSFSILHPRTSLVLTAGGFQLPEHSFQYSLQLKAHPYREAHNMCSSHSTHPLFSVQIWKVMAGSTETFGTQASSHFHCLKIWVVDIAVVQVVRQIYVESHCYQTVMNDSEAAIMGSYITWSDQSTISVIHKPSRLGCSIFVFISHSLMQVLAITRMFI